MDYRKLFSRFIRYYGPVIQVATNLKSGVTFIETLLKYRCHTLKTEENKHISIVCSIDSCYEYIEVQTAAVDVSYYIPICEFCIIIAELFAVQNPQNPWLQFCTFVLTIHDIPAFIGDFILTIPQNPTRTMFETTFPLLRDNVWLILSGDPRARTTTVSPMINIELLHALAKARLPLFASAPIKTETFDANVARVIMSILDPIFENDPADNLSKPDIETAVANIIKVHSRAWSDSGMMMMCAPVQKVLRVERYSNNEIEDDDRHVVVVFRNLQASGYGGDDNVPMMRDGQYAMCSFEKDNVIQQIEKGGALVKLVMDKTNTRLCIYQTLARMFLCRQFAPCVSSILMFWMNGKTVVNVVDSGGDRFVCYDLLNKLMHDDIDDDSVRMVMHVFMVMFFMQPESTYKIENQSRLLVACWMIQKRVFNNDGYWTAVKSNIIGARTIIKIYDTMTLGIQYNVIGADLALALLNGIHPTAGPLLELSPSRIQQHTRHMIISGRLLERTHVHVAVAKTVLEEPINEFRARVMLKLFAAFDFMDLHGTWSLDGRLHLAHFFSVANLSMLSSMRFPVYYQFRTGEMILDNEVFYMSFNCPERLKSVDTCHLIDSNNVQQQQPPLITKCSTADAFYVNKEIKTVVENTNKIYL